MMTLLVLAVLFVAFANGANDNFKGVATLFGSGTAGYGRAIRYATATTLAGSAAALLLGGTLARTFSGQGLVSVALTCDHRFLVAVAGGAALTVLLASRLGMPVSTTHALVGGLTGAGLAAAGSEVRWAAVANTMLYPLLLSPFAAILLTLLLYPGFRAARRWLGVEEETCLCVGGAVEAVDIGPDGAAVLRSTGAALTLGEISSCRSRYTGRVLGVSAQQVLDRLHFLSAGAVGGARGLNDTPKIAALLIAAAPPLGSSRWHAAVALAIATGGLLGARRVAETMSHRITRMNDGQAFSANLATSLLVIAASGLGMPVSTTHVSVGALFGIGLVNGEARWSSILQILLGWVTTLPLAGTAAAALYYVLPGST
jgi:PiT family inorganic phosphate transporter